MLPKKTIDRLLKEQHKVPPLYKEAELWQFDKELSKQARNRNMYLTGPPGVGKTHLAWALLRYYVAHKKSCLFATVPDLLLRIKASFSETSAEEEAQLVKQYRNIDVLFLDDLGAEKATEWTLQTLYLIISWRLDWEGLTVVTSNLTLDSKELSDKLGSRVLSRLEGLCGANVITMAGENLRNAEHKEKNG